MEFEKELTKSPFYFMRRIGFITQNTLFVNLEIFIDHIKISNIQIMQVLNKQSGFMSKSRGKVSFPPGLGCIYNDG
jgi:hypothetical protein